MPISIDWKRDSYDSILIIINWLIKIVYYKPVKVIINTPDFDEIIIDMIVRHHGLLNSIVTKLKLLFTSKFWLLLYYFQGIKRKLSTAFYPQTDSPTKRQKSMIEAYLQTFINFEQNDWAQLFFMVEFAYNNAKNTSTSHLYFELNCEYHPQVFYKENLDPRLKSKTAEKLLFKL